MSEAWVVFPLLGAVVGFAAGLLGIGGGAIMVPVLTVIFLHQGVPSDQVVYLALGTSMASIIITSFSSMMAHHSGGGVRWSVFRPMVIGVIMGAFSATFLVPFVKGIYLAGFFAVFMTYVAVQMLFSKRFEGNERPKNRLEFLIAGGGIGAVSALVSIGGGSLTVPYLSWRNLPIKEAIGTSAALGFPLSLAGTAGFLINGHLHAPQDLQTGFVHLHAVFLISTASVLFAPLGARLSRRLPVVVLKKIFGFLLVFLSANMLYTLFSGTG